MQLEPQRIVSLAIERARRGLLVREALSRALLGLFIGSAVSAAGSLARVFADLPLHPEIRLAAPIVAAFLAAAWAARSRPDRREAAAVLDRAIGAGDVVVAAEWAERALPAGDSRRDRLATEAAARIELARRRGGSPLGRTLSLGAFPATATAVAAFLLVLLEPETGVPGSASVVPFSPSPLDAAVHALSGEGDRGRDLLRRLEALRERVARGETPSPAALEAARRLRDDLRARGRRNEAQAVPDSLEPLRRAGERGGAARVADAARRLAEGAISDPELRERLAEALREVGRERAEATAAAGEAASALARWAEPGGAANLAAALSRLALALEPADPDLIRAAAQAIERWLDSVGASSAPEAPARQDVRPRAADAPSLPESKPRWALADSPFLDRYFRPTAAGDRR